MLLRFKHNYFALAALVSAVLFSILEVGVPLSSGPRMAELNNPVALVCEQVAAGFAIHGGVRPLTLQLFAGVTTVLLALFLCCLFLRVYRPGKRSMAHNDALIIAQLLIGLCVDSVLLNILVAAQLGALMPWRRGLAWLAFQVGIGLTIDVVLMFTLFAGDSARVSILWNCTFERIVQALGFGIALIVGVEQRSRLTIAAAHAELLATQSLLGDMMRASERVRIARDLHDVIGHHLTALNLHLDLALRQTEGKAGKSLQTSRQLADDLLESVRTLVGSERRDQPVKLREALQTLCSGIPAPKIVLTFEDGLDIDPPHLAHALFCCVQEAITNAVRHAGADVMTIDIRRVDGKFTVAVSDDGRGSQGGAEGNGLRGMRERLTQHGGGLSVGNLPGRGFGIDMWLAPAGTAP